MPQCSICDHTLLTHKSAVRGVWNKSTRPRVTFEAVCILSKYRVSRLSFPSAGFVLTIHKTQGPYCSFHRRRNIQLYPSPLFYQYVWDFSCLILSPKITSFSDCKPKGHKNKSTRYNLHIQPTYGLKREVDDILKKHKELVRSGDNLALKQWEEEREKQILVRREVALSSYLL